MILTIGFAVALFAMFLYIHSRHKSPVFAAITNMILGVTSLVLLAPSVEAEVNLHSVFLSLTLGLPGALLTIFLEFIK
jgi:amino acid transporter